MKRAILVLLAVFSCHLFAQEKIGDQVRTISGQDKAMQAAIEKARNGLEAFFETAKNPPEGAKDFKLKVMVSDDSGIEHLWFSPFKEVKGGYAGVLVNDPNLISTMKFGEVYAFRKSQITDWGYVQNGKQIGSYTVCVLFKTMEKSVVEQYKRDHGFVCE